MNKAKKVQPCDIEESVLRYLISKGADPNGVDENGYLPLERAHTRTGIATLGAELSQANLLHDALQIPWENRCIEPMEVLLNVWVDINARALHCEGPAPLRCNIPPRWGM